MTPYSYSVRLTYEMNSPPSLKWSRKNKPDTLNTLMGDDIDLNVKEHTVVGVDSVKLQALEDQFKQRYSTLKRVYEDRLKSLSAQVRAVYLEVS